MKSIHLDNIKAFSVISDVHLREPSDALTNLFIQALHEIKDVEAVILLGDIFDFIAGAKPFFLNYWKDVFDAFESLKKRNIRVYFTEGNHDFGFEHFQHPRFLECFTDCGDYEIIINHSTHGQTLLKHGDDVVSQARYRQFRRVVKSNWFQKSTVKLLPGSFIHAIFSRTAKLSRKSDQYRNLSDEFMDEKIIDFLKKYYPQCDIFIMGHVHKEIDHVIQAQKSVRLLVGDAWFDHPSILTVNENEICRTSIQSK